MLAVIIPHFNPAGFVSPVDNYVSALAQFRLQYDSEHIYPIEVVYEGQDQIDPLSIVMQGSSLSRYLWQKEALFNHVVSILPARYDKVALLDADVTFLNNDWPGDVDRLLDRCDIIQPYSECHWTDRQHRMTHRRNACCVTRKFPDPVNSHCGFAWAFRRSVLDDLGGLFWQDITGANDGVLSACLFGDEFILSSNLKVAAESYKEKIKKLQVSTGYIEGAVIHAWHGSLDNRQYKTRHQILEESVYTQNDTRLVNGLIEWNTENQILMNKMKKYFVRRKEDG